MCSGRSVAHLNVALIKNSKQAHICNFKCSHEFSQQNVKKIFKKGSIINRILLEPYHIKCVLSKKCYSKNSITIATGKHFHNCRLSKTYYVLKYRLEIRFISTLHQFYTTPRKNRQHLQLHICHYCNNFCRKRNKLPCGFIPPRMRSSRRTIARRTHVVRLMSLELYYTRNLRLRFHTRTCPGCDINLSIAL